VHVTENTHPDGLTLKLERVAERVTGRALAHAMGVSASRIGHIEASAFVTPETAQRYRASLGTCIEDRTRRNVA
jgi:plasmid maintenance system antidote protein VapI